MTGYATEVSFLAGAIISLSSMPKILALIIEGYSTASPYLVGDFCRDTAIVVGNLLWVYFGIIKGIPAIIAFCGLNALLTSILVVKPIVLVLMPLVGRIAI